MAFKLNYLKLWESLKSEVSLMPFKTNDPNERMILQLASEFLSKKMEGLENAQREEYEKALNLFNTIRN